MKQLKMPKRLRFNLNKMFQLVEEAGVIYGQPQDIIEKEKSEIENKLIDELNFVLYQSGNDGLKTHINYHLKELNVLTTKELEYLQRWHDPNQSHNYGNLFLAKFMSDIYKYILKENTEQVSVSRNKLKYTYHWLGKPDELKEFYQEIRGIFIANDTSEDDCKAIFEAKILDNLKKPVRWHDENASELIYFITKLGNSGLIEPSKRADYIRMTACFAKSDGTPFNKSSFPSLKQKMDVNLSKHKQKAIDKIVEKFL
jgi:hypothetical protein